MLTKEPSKLWPAIKAVAKHVKIPGTDLTLECLTDIQDDLSQGHFEEEVKSGLSAMRDHLEEMVGLLRAQGVALDLGQLDAETVRFVENLYLRRIAQRYRYADFKGIAQEVQFISLELDEVFVNLKMTREQGIDLPSNERSETIRHFFVFEEVSRGVEREVSEVLVRWPSDGPLRIDEVLAEPGGAVILGGPGSGKTTLVKRLARSCALGPEMMRQRYPAMPWAFPLVVSLTIFDEWRQASATLLDYVRYDLDRIGGPALVEVFNRRWEEGSCLVLLDGLDEIAFADHRVRSARAVDELYQQLRRNRALTTTRILGYNLCRLAVPAIHVTLQPFSPDDIETFVRHWYQARERAVHPNAPDVEQANVAAAALLNEIRGNPGVASLATNPLMLTVIALIKHQGVDLPQRRVELYEVALSTLLRSWNKARSLSGRPLGHDIHLDQTKRVWAAVAHWMHAETSRGTLPRSVLHRKLVEVLVGDLERDEYTALAEADSYLDAAAETSGLLEARGPNVFAFMHQTLQEYLAAQQLAIPTRYAPDRIMAVADDPRWHEVIRLAVGTIGVLQRDDDALREFVDLLLARREEDPLEPFLSTALLLAAACIADDVGFKRHEKDRVVVEICARLVTSPYEQMRNRLTDALDAMPISPGPAAVEALLGLEEDRSARVRSVVARKLGSAEHENASARAALRRLLDDEDSAVAAHAALGLFVSEDQIPHRLLVSIATVAPTAWIEDHPGFKRRVLELANSKDDSMRYGVALACMRWGPQPGGLQVLLRLLEDPVLGVRVLAGAALGGWGPQNEALPALLRILANPKPERRWGVLQTLMEWGPQSWALPTLLRLLEDPSPGQQQSVLRVLAGWGLQSEALPLLRRLLEDADPTIQVQAAATLAAWGLPGEARPVLLRILEDTSPVVRWAALEPVLQMLLESEPLSEALPALRRLLEDADPTLRVRAAATLAAWGLQSEARPALLHLLEEADDDVRVLAAETLAAKLHTDAVPGLFGLVATEYTRVTREDDLVAPAISTIAASLRAGGAPVARAIFALLGVPENIAEPAANCLEQPATEPPPMWTPEARGCLVQVLRIATEASPGAGEFMLTWIGDATGARYSGSTIRTIGRKSVTSYDQVPPRLRQKTITNQ
jgi:HEAT repeat protein